MKEYSKMDKFELITECIQQESKIEKLSWELDVEKKRRLYDLGQCPLNKSVEDKIIACVYSCEDCYKRRENI